MGILQILFVLRFVVHIWKKYRRIISPVMHPRNVDTFLPIFNDVSRQLVTNLGIGGKPVDPQREIFNAAMDAISRKIILCYNIHISL